MSTVHHLVGSAEVARILGVTRQRLAQLASIPDFPRPDADLACGRIWKREAIDDWVAVHPDRALNLLVDRGEVSPETPAVLRQVERLAFAQALLLHHSWVGPEHVLTALTDRSCPGDSAAILSSLGVVQEEVRAALIAMHGDPFEPSGRGAMLSRAAQLLFEVARRKAVESADSHPSSEHVLLALTENWEHQAGTALLFRRGLTASMVIDCVHGGHAPASPPDLGPWPPPPPPPEGIQLALSPAGHDPWRRRPWGSAFFRRTRTNPSESEEAPVRPGSGQYFFDRDGYPVLTRAGSAVHIRVADDRRAVRNSSGQLEITAVAVPPGWQFRRHRSP